MENKKKLTNKEVKKQIKIIIDDIATTGKKSIRSLIKLMVERTANTADEIVDKGVDKKKIKIDKKESKKNEKD